MTDLIRRTDAIEALHGEVQITGKENAMAVQHLIGRFTFNIANIPSADVLNELVPPNDKIYIGQKGAVVMSIGAYKRLTEHNRGEWIVITEPTEKYGEIKFKCSACGMVYAHEHRKGADIMWNFCPQCGASMREREGE